jgi:uncharacterized protein YjbI with pentapeptide repeats
VGWKKPGRKADRPSKRRIAWPRWTGFRGMTVRDWLQLLIVPFALVVISFVFTMQQDARQRAIEEQRVQDVALQGYLDQMGTLMLEDLSDPKVRTLMRARTLSVLQRLDASRKVEVMHFLSEADLVSTDLVNSESESDGLTAVEDPILSLGGADLSDTNLYQFPLIGTNLVYANLSGAKLSRAHLIQADLVGANLSNADLSEAGLLNANLSGANLNGADLSSANLGEALLLNADLSNADLSNVDLSNVALTGARVTQEQLEHAASLEGATMPDGQQMPLRLPENPGHWPLETGEYTTDEFQPAFLFKIGKGWVVPSLETTDAVWLQTGTGGGELNFTNPSHVFDPSNPSEAKELPAPENAEEWVSWFQRHPNLDTSKPVPVSVGGASGMRIDVTPSSMPENYPRNVCGAEPCVPLYPLSNETGIRGYEGYKDRFIIVDASETVNIDVSAPTGTFDEFLPKAQKVLDSVEGKGG